MKDFIEQQIIDAVRKMLTERVNEILSGYDLLVQIIEFGEYLKFVKIDIALNTCETTEKERIIRLDAYSLTITFTLPETADSEIFCYGYAGAVGRALYDNPTLGGVVDRAVVSGKKYVPPKKAYGGNEWEIVISLRVTVEEMGNVC